MSKTTIKIWFLVFVFGLFNEQNLEVNLKDQIQILNGIYSQGCIDLLAEKFNVDVNPGMSDEDKAVYESFRALIEDRLIPMMALERFFWLKVSDKHFLSCSPVATMVFSLPDQHKYCKKIVLVIEKNTIFCNRMLVKLVPVGFSHLMNQNNWNSNWEKILGFRNMQEKLENTQPSIFFDRSEQGLQVDFFR